MDRVVMYAEAGKQYRECVSCGFKDEMRVNSPPLELETRVTQSLSPKDKSERPVRVIDPLEKP
jgi:Zn ribbon nucleic-acid-binding protein